MCYHYSLGKVKVAVEKKYNASAEAMPETLNFHAGAFGTPVQMPVLTLNDPEKLTMMRWGLIPFWSKEEKLKFNTANAAVETVTDKASYREPIKTKRCLVPADGFYEWRTEGANKYPYFIHLLEEEIFSFAGIYDEWVNKSTGEIVQSFSILTTEANDLMAKIHNTKKRMPIILNEDLEKRWLTDEPLPDLLSEAAQPFPTQLMVAHTISKSFLLMPNGPEKQLPFEYPELALMDS